MSEQKDGSLWSEVGNRCLLLARDLIIDEYARTPEHIHAVCELIHAAVEIDDLNRRWEGQTRFGAAAFQGPLF